MEYCGAGSVTDLVKGKLEEFNFYAPTSINLGHVVYGLSIRPFVCLQKL